MYRNLFLPAIVLLIAAAPCLGAPATITQTSENFMTARGLIPGFYGPQQTDCLFPYHRFTDGNQINHSWTKIVMENDYLRLDVIPGLGGRILRMVNKTTGSNQFYDNPAGFKQTPWGRLQFPATGGIEFMLPLDEHHGPFYLPFVYVMEDTPDGVRLTMVFDEDTVYPSGENNRFRLTLVLDLPDDEAAFYLRQSVLNESDQAHWLMYWSNAISAPGPGNILYNPRTNANQHMIYPRDVTRIYNHNDNGNSNDIFGGMWNELTWPVHAGRDISNLETFITHNHGWMGTFVARGTPVSFCGIYNRTANEGLVKTFPEQARAGVNSGVKYFHWGGQTGIAPIYGDGNSTLIEMMTGPVTVFQEPVDCNVGPPHPFVPDDYVISMQGGETITWTDTYFSPHGIGDVVHVADRAALNLSAPGAVTCGNSLPLTLGAYPTSVQGSAALDVTIGGIVVYSQSGLAMGPGAAPGPFFANTSPVIDNVPTGAQTLRMTLTLDGGETVVFEQPITVNGPCGAPATATPTHTPDPNATATPTATATWTVTDTPTPAPCQVTECFETMPAWAGQFESNWGNGNATWSIDPQGFEGASLRAVRSSNNSAVRTLRFDVNPNHEYRIGIYMKTDAMYTGCFWMETGVRPGAHAASDFDTNAGAWTMVHKIASDCAGGAGGQTSWQRHEATFNAGDNAFVTVAFKLGRSTGGETIAAGWDHLDLVNLTALPTNTPTPTATPTPVHYSSFELR